MIRPHLAYLNNGLQPIVLLIDEGMLHEKPEIKKSIIL